MQFDQAAEFLVDLAEMKGGVFVGISRALGRALRLVVPDQRHEVGTEECLVAVVDVIVGHVGSVTGIGRRPLHRGRPWNVLEIARVEFVETLAAARIDFRGGLADLRAMPVEGREHAFFVARRIRLRCAATPRLVIRNAASIALS